MTMSVTDLKMISSHIIAVSKRKIGRDTDNLALVSDCISDMLEDCFDVMAELRTRNRRVLSHV